MRSQMASARVASPIFWCHPPTSNCEQNIVEAFLQRASVSSSKSLASLSLSGQSNHSSRIKSLACRYRRRKFFVSGFTYLLRMTLRFCQTDKEKSSKSFSDLLLSLAADGRWIFSFESSGQVGPMMDSTINSCFPFKALCIFSISLDDYFFHNQSMYL